MRLLLDIDGVCADLHGKLCRVYNADYGDTITPDTFLEWNMAPYVKCGVAIYDYFLIPGFFGDLDLFPGVAEAVEVLCQLVEVVAVTATPIPSIASRIDWIHQNLPWIATDNIVITQRKNLVEGEFIVDDKPENLQGQRTGRFLVTHSHNRRASGDFVRIGSLPEIVPTIQSIVEKREGKGKNGPQ